MKRGQLIGNKGFSLVEILVGLTVLAVGVSSGLVLISQQQFLASTKEKNIRAQALISEGQGAVKSINKKNWDSLTEGEHGLVFSGGEWQFYGNYDTNDIFTRKIIITNINAQTKQVVSRVEWGQDSMIELSTILTDWRNVQVSQGNWWDSDYGFRREILVSTGHNSPFNGYDGYTTRIIDFNTFSLISDKMQDDCDDLRIVHKTGSSTWAELDRQIFFCNASSTEIRFKIQDDIAASSTDENYYIYYGNATVTSAPSNLSNVYLWYDDASSDRESEYIQGRVDETAHGAPLENWGDTVVWDSAGYYTYNTGDNYPESFRPASLTERDIYVEYEEYQTNAWPWDMTSGPLARWVGSGSGSNETSNHWYYYEIADSTFQPGGPYVSHDDITADNRESVIIENGVLGEFPANQWVKIGLAAWGINDTNLKAWYDSSPSSQESGGWETARFSGIHSASNDNESAGQFGIWIQQDTGRFKNIIARRYIEPEPTTSIGDEEEP